MTYAERVRQARLNAWWWQMAIASGYQNASGGTTFTSPLGMPGGASTAKNTLLGL